MIKQGAKKVVLFDFQEPYSAGPRGCSRGRPEGEGRHDDASVGHQHVTDFSSFVTKVPSSADFVFFPTQKPGTRRTSPSS